MTAAPPAGGPLRVAFLGGLGEIGRNCAVIEYAGSRLLIDCGLAFPDSDQPGVDIILPDFSWLAEAPERVVGVVLTHAHEDHMGALPYFLRDYRCRSTAAACRSGCSGPSWRSTRSSRT
jgi:ribonuclease J